MQLCGKAIKQKFFDVTTCSSGNWINKTKQFRSLVKYNCGAFHNNIFKAYSDFSHAYVRMVRSGKLCSLMKSNLLYFSSRLQHQHCHRIIYFNIIINQGICASCRAIALLRFVVFPSSFHKWTLYAAFSCVSFSTANSSYTFLFQSHIFHKEKQFHQHQRPTNGCACVL